MVYKLFKNSLTSIFFVFCIFLGGFFVFVSNVQAGDVQAYCMCISSEDCDVFAPDAELHTAPSIAQVDFICNSRCGFTDSDCTGEHDSSRDISCVTSGETYEAARGTCEAPTPPADDASSASSSKLEPPIRFATEPLKIVGLIIKAIFGLVGSLALAMFVYGGLMWLTSAGNPEKVKKGRDVIVWAVIGLAVIFSSYALVDFVLGALGG